MNTPNESYSADESTGGPIAALVIAVPVSLILWGIVFWLAWAATR